MWNHAFIIPILIFSIPLVAIVSHSMLKVLHMRHEERMMRGDVAGEDAERFDRIVTRLEGRMKVLEAILDDEVPGWRRKYDD